MYNNINYKILPKYISKVFKKLSDLFIKLSILSKNISSNIYPYKALNNLDIKLSNYLPEILNKDTFYVEVGANDGINQSNTFFLEKKYKAKGLLIEPCQSLFQKCIVNRSSENIFENCALVDSDYQYDHIELIYANLMSISPSTSSLDINNHLQSSRVHEKISYKLYSKAKTLSEVLLDNNIKEIDLLSIDVEGSELNLLNGIDFDIYLVKNILIETKDFKSIHSFLQNKNYLLFAQLSYHDYLFKLN
tara:strand:- start:1342 stop:2085 length:744 start_codon:yes stop_codon:yes gene_type:complete